MEEEEAGLAEITLHALIFTPPFDDSTHTHTCRLSGTFGHARISKAATQTTAATSMTFDTESMGG